MYPGYPDALELVQDAGIIMHACRLVTFTQATRSRGIRFLGAFHGQVVALLRHPSGSQGTNYMKIILKVVWVSEVFRVVPMVDTASDL